jgi:hypothetical protein
VHAEGIFLQLAVLGCKASIAVLLLAAGGAKLADLAGFSATVRLFVPSRVPRAPATSSVLAAVIAVGEVVAGAASLSMPAVGWLNPAVLVICCCFAVVWTVGYVRHAGRPCRCFGALSRRGFTQAGIGRAAGLTLAAAAATASVPQVAIELSLPTRLGLLAGGALVAMAAFSAAAAAGAKQEPELALWRRSRFTWRSLSGRCSARLACW